MGDHRRLGALSLKKKTRKGVFEVVRADTQYEPTGTREWREQE